MGRIIDLHIHTNCSDGDLTPYEVIDMAFENNIDTIAIADHDTIDAYNKELFDYAKEKNIKLITGVEISTKANKYGLHVLGYNFDLNNEEFNLKLSKLRNVRHDYLFNVASKLRELGYEINTDELDKIEAVTKAHIALDVINNPSNADILMDSFKYIPSKGEFIETIMNEGCAAYVKKESISPQEASKLIKSAGGKVVLAHPVAYTYEDNLNEDDIKNIVKDMDADGIEAYYIYIDKDNNKHNDIDKWLEFAKDNNLFITVGSDFHKDDKIHPFMGLINEDISISDEEMDEIISNIIN